MKRVQLLGIRLALWTLLIFVLCVMPIPKVDTDLSFPHLDKIVHFGMFFLFSLFAYSWLRGKRKKQRLWIGFIVFLLVALYGAGIEWLQGKFFQRSADIWDWIADVIGGLMGILTYPLLHYLKQKIILRLHRIFVKNRR